ncbi:MAG TPA: TonB-dependent receptor, partial [Bryobacteraceae bacterium]|nr:TonB-dependent receptor [Bryobacteraceae bacterium]
MLGFRIVAVLLVLELAAVAQTYGNLTGVVTDSSGAVLSGASITLSNLQLGSTQEVRTNEAGLYRFSLIPPGRYKLTVNASGFGTVTVNNLEVEVNASVRQDVPLRVADVSQQVLVEAAATSINQENAELGDVIETRKIVELPLNGRNFLQLGQLTTGTLPPSVQNNESTTQSFNGGRTNLTLSISGVREISAAYLFDGIPSKHDYYGGVGSQPALDAISEFKIQRGYFSPQFGLGAIVNVVSRSGTNQFHGSLWEFVRNNVFDARNFFDANRLPFRQNQYGAAAGLPVVRNKVFVFGDFERLSARRGFQAQGVTASAAMLSGDFSGLPTIYDPATLNPATGQRQPFPGNRIPADRISRFASDFSRYIPAANTAGQVNLRGTTQLIQDDDKYDVRGDYVASDKDRFFARLSVMNSALLRTALTPLGGNSVPLRSRNAVASWTRVISPTLVNDLRVGLDRVFLFSNMPEEAASQPNWPQAFGLRNLNEIAECNGLPVVALAGYLSYGASGTCINTGNNNYHLIDNLSWVRGKHTVTAGFELINVRFKETSSL